MIQAIRMLVWMVVLTGIIYSACVTVVALGMARRAGGDLIVIQRQVVGAKLIGQKFESAGYFWSRPSASHYSALPAQGSNLGPTSAKLRDLVEERKNRFKSPKVPSVLLFASGSGLDPHITREAAHFQAERVATARKISVDELKALIDTHTTKPCLKFLGQEEVNVLLLNVELDRKEKR